jgi:hypothetical protein
MKSRATRVTQKGLASTQKSRPKRFECFRSTLKSPGSGSSASERLKLELRSSSSASSVEQEWILKRFECLRGA